MRAVDWRGTMRRLEGADRYHLYVESAVQHQHTLKVLVIDRDAATAPIDLGSVCGWAGAAAARCPALRWRLHAVGTSAPVWVDDPMLDLDHHVGVVHVPAPGGRHELAATIATVKELKLDRRRPLWRLWLVEGMGDGRVALIWVFHHALADGGETAKLLEQLHGRGVPVGDPPLGLVPAGPVPTATATLVDGVGALARRVLDLPSLGARSIRAATAVRRRRRRGLSAPPRPFEAPATAFGQGLTPNRACASANVPMAAVAEVRRAFGVTVNDVFLATVSGALASYLSSGGSSPRRSLTACVPVSIRADHEQGALGNRLGTWFVTLGTDIDDPVARLAAVARSARIARAAREECRSTSLQQEWMEYTALFRGYIAIGNASTRRAGRSPYSVIASNVRGPAPLVFAGAPVVEIQSYSQLAAGIGLNVTAWSYGDVLTAGLVACPEHVPDLWDLADRLAPALDELVDAARTSATASVA